MQLGSQGEVRMKVKDQKYSFGCGAHSLSGTYAQQAREYAKIMRLWRRMEEEGAFEHFEQGPYIFNATEISRMKAELVWEVYCASA